MSRAHSVVEINGNRYDAATGKREVWVPASRLVPEGDSVPLAVEDYSVSPDGKRLLVLTNSKKVWRENTRGDFWALDLEYPTSVAAEQGGNTEESPPHWSTITYQFPARGKRDNGVEQAEVKYVW